MSGEIFPWNKEISAGEVLAQAAQRSCGCPIPGSVQSQIGCGPRQPDLVVDNSVHGKGFGTRELDGFWASFQTKPFCDSITPTSDSLISNTGVSWIFCGKIILFMWSARCTSFCIDSAHPRVLMNCDLVILWLFAVMLLALQLKTCSEQKYDHSSF